MKRHVLILAAGKSKRMKSKTSKVLHPILGKTVLEYVVDLAERVSSDHTVIVVGDEHEDIKTTLDERNVSLAVQREQLGTGHAVMSAEEYLEGGTTLILMGDGPCLKPETLEALYEDHLKEKRDLTVLSLDVEDPTDYGRLVKEDDQLLRITEHRDCSEEELSICEINTGIFLLDTNHLKEELKNLTDDNDQKQYYITDLVDLFNQRGLRVGSFKMRDAQEFIGINDRYQLHEATEILRHRINEGWMRSGVTMINPSSIYIDASVEIEADATIYPNTILKGKTIIAEDAEIGPNTTLTNVQVGVGTKVENSVLLDSVVGEHSTVGPFAYVRPGSIIGSHCKVGDFVEVKNSTLGDRSKVSHLSYVGDSDVGTDVNIGCGVVFVNYDGKVKHRTQVDDYAFIGCNVNLISPVHVHSGAYVAAGTTVTENVPEDALVVGRVRQEIKEGRGKGRTKVQKGEK